MPEDTKTHVRRLVYSVLMTVVMSLIMILLNWIALNVSELCTGSLPFFSKRTQPLNAHENQLSGNIVKPELIHERLCDVGGLNAIKSEIKAHILMPLQYPKIFFGDVRALHPPKGVLFYGPPGTGKTMLAKAIAAEAKCPFLSLTLSSLENKYYGESSKLLGATFSLARKIQPCIVFFDEIDGMLRTRSDMDQSCVYGFKTEILTHMDGINTKNTDAVIVIGCTNSVERLDPAIKRRLSKQYKVDLPTNDEIVDIFMLNLKNTSIQKGEVAALVAHMRPGCSGSDIANIVRNAWSLQMLQYTSSSKFIARLEQDPNATAQDIQEFMGCIKARHLVQAMEKSGLWIPDDDEAPPPQSSPSQPPPPQPPPPQPPPSHPTAPHAVVDQTSASGDS